MEKAANLNDAGNAIEVGSKGALVFLTDPLSIIVALEKRSDKSLEITYFFSYLHNSVSF